MVTVNRHILYVSLCVSPCLSLSVKGKWGIEMPHRNLLVMEGTYYRYMYLQDRLAGTIPMYVGIIHVLLHRLGVRSR